MKPLRTGACILLLTLFGAAGAGASANARPALLPDPPESSAPARADHREPIIFVEANDPEDRGSVPPGAPVWRRFTVTNLSQHAVHLSIVDRTCACVVEELPAADLPPGASVPVRVGATATEVPGTQRHSAVLEAREVDVASPRRDRASLGFAYTPDVEFTVVPLELTEHAIAGEPYEGHIYVQRPRVATLGVHDLSSTIPGLRVGPARVLPENRGVLEVPFSGVFAEPGLREGLVRFATNSASRPAVAVSVAVRVLPRWRASPPGIVRVLDGGGERTEHAVDVLPRFAGETRQLRAAVMQAEAPGVGADLRPGDDGVYRLVVTLRPTEIPTRTGSVQVSVLDSDGNIAVVVPVVWYTPKGVQPASAK